MHSENPHGTLRATGARTGPSMGSSKRDVMSQALPPGLEALIDQALLSVEPGEEHQSFLDALVEAEAAGELTRDQAETLAAIVGHAHAQEVACALGIREIA